MNQIPFKTALLVACSLVAGRASSILPQGEEKVGSVPPRLTLILSVDQFRSDYLTRFEPFLGPGGFRRIYQEGVSCKDSAYGHAKTETGPGHSVIGAGAYPHRSGIVGNNWRDRKTLKQVYCVAGRKGPSPENLLVPTLADLWKKRYGARARILSISFKDRSAVLMGGHGGDGVFWFDGVLGRLRSSPWYDERSATPARDAAKAWVTSLSKKGLEGRLIDAWLGKTWSALPCPTQNRAHRKLWDSLPPDNRKGERARNGWQPHFPRRYARGPGPRYFAQVKESPAGDEFLIQCLLNAITSETLELGHREDAVDLALISLSSLDYVGHAHGPYSHEVRDLFLRLDRQLAGLFRALDERIGKGRWTLAMSGDHGVASTVERSLRLGRDAGVVSRHRPVKGAGLVRARLGEFLLKEFKGSFRKGFLANATEGLGAGLVDGLCMLYDGEIYLRPDLLEASGIRPEDLLGAVDKFFSKESYVLATFRRAQLKDPQDSIARSVALSFHPERSGDLLIVLKPNWHWRWGLGGATHGSPHPYDREVPLLFLGRGIAKGKMVQTAGVEDLAPTLGQILGIPRSKTWEGQALQEALEEPIQKSPAPEGSSRKTRR